MNRYDPKHCLNCTDIFAPTHAQDKYCCARCALYGAIKVAGEWPEEGECWPVPCVISGYGSINYHRKTYLAHRLMWLFEHPNARPPAFIYHTCGTHNCANPAHLMASRPAAVRTTEKRQSPRTEISDF